MVDSDKQVALPRTLSIGGGLVKKMEQWIGRRSLAGDHAFFDPARFSWTGDIEQQWPAIRDELIKVMADDMPIPGFEEISHDQRKLTDDGRWQTYFLLGYGVPFAENIAACPQTWKALKNIPGLTTAFFSILAPGKKIPPHRGPYKGVLRYHLGLIIPENREKAWINVKGEVRHWEPGKSLIFDDTFVHSAANESGQVRVVLFVDFARPLPWPLDLANRLILRLIARSGYVQEAVKNYRVWRRTKLDAGR